jgi:hypothetical protein
VHDARSIERPKIVKNAKTGLYVMWCVHHRHTRSACTLGVNAPLLPLVRPAT